MEHDQSRAVINFLNEVDKEIETHGKDGPIQKALAASPRKEIDSLRGSRPFKTPDPRRYAAPQTTRISYTRNNEQIEFLREALGAGSARAVGERTFDDAYREQKGE